MPIHPLIVHFPIALFITALGLEILSLIFKKEILHHTAWYNYILGIFSALATVLAALWDGMSLTRPLFYIHRNFGYITLGFSIISGLILAFVKRKSPKFFRILFFVFLVITVGLVSITAYYGGELVYKYGAGIR
jgi:uncharacterized membrane protein